MTYFVTSPNTPNRGLFVPRQVKLLVVEGINASQEFTLLDNQKLIVGRGSQSDTQLDDPVMSREHFVLENKAGRIVIEDAQSSTGTFVNGQRISMPQQLHTGAQIVAGNTRLSLSISGGSDADTMGASARCDHSELRCLSGEDFGGYELGKIIGEGKSGIVYQAYNAKKDRKAAVKVFSAEYTKDGEHRERFVRGMQAFCNVKSPHLIRLYQAGKSSSYCYAVMKLINGENLASLIDRIGIDGMLDWKEVWKCAMHVGTALVAAYEHEVTHRNLVPSNIIRRTRNRSYFLGDFTLAKPVDPLVPGVTKVDDILGDIFYLPPERIQDATTTDTRSDIYGLGATCYALLTGKPPAHGSSLMEIMTSIRGEVPKLPSSIQMSVNDHFQAAVMKMINKHPDDRYQTPHEMLKELERIGKLNGLIPLI